MIDEAHRLFTRWAAWVLAPVPGESLGYGKNILARIYEGRGQIMPGAPRGSYVRVVVDTCALEIEAYLKKIGKEDVRIIRMFYLDQRSTVEQKAHRLYMSRKQLYLELDRIHQHFLAQRCSE